MASSYTYPVIEGQCLTLRELAESMTEQFSEGRDAILERMVTQKERMEKAKSELLQFQKMSRPEVEVLYEKIKQDELEQLETYATDRRERLSRIHMMLSKLYRWKPGPLTKKLFDFMEEQLLQARDEESQPLPKRAEISVSQWEAKRLNDLQKEYDDTAKRYNALLTKMQNARLFFEELEATLPKEL